MVEIAELIAAAIRDLEYNVEVLRDGLPTEVPDTINLVVAPHEYFFLLSTYTHDDRLDAARSCVMLCTEQPGTPWFERSLEYCRVAQGTFDINTSAAKALNDGGIDAIHLPLGYHPSWDVWSGKAADRPIDVMFMGGSTPRRQAVLARAADQLAALRCDLRIFRPEQTVVTEREDFVAGRRKQELHARSKILLNVHRGEHSSFEWHRALAALANGCLFLTEPSPDATPLVAGEHFVEAPTHALADHAVALASNEGLRDRLVRQAYAFVVDNLSQTKLVAARLPALLEGRRTRRPLSTVVRATQRAVRAAGPRPGAPPAQQTAPTPSATGVAPNATNVWLRRILLNQLSLKRAIEAVESRLAFADVADHMIVKTRAYDYLQPDVSVVVTVYNYADYIRECLDSVVGSEGVVPEIIIVEDHSADASVERIREFIDEHDHYPIKLVEHRFNRGLPRARNAGFAAARTDYVFVLDADNTIYPSSLAKLRQAMVESGCEFAYGAIATFGESDELLSWYPWNVNRLVTNNRIDAMAMIRRSAWRSVDGYTTDDTVYGWEDFFLWLTFAARGYRGAFVSEIVGRYRQHTRSMLKLSNLDMDTPSQFVQAKFPMLPWGVYA